MARKKKPTPAPVLHGPAGQAVRSPLFLPLLLALAVRVVLAAAVYGHKTDIGCFTSWAVTASNHFSSFYDTAQFADYPPLYIYVLALLGPLVKSFAGAGYFIVKLPAMAADLLAGILIYRFSAKRIPVRKAVIAACFWLFNPAVILNSAIWGQVDGFFTLILLAALLFLMQSRLTMSGIFFALLVLMKPQGIIFGPVIIFELLRRKSWQDFFRTASAGLVTLVLGALPFAAGKSLLWLPSLYAGTSNGYPYGTVNAANLYALLGLNWKSDTVAVAGFLPLVTLGMGLIVLVVLFSGAVYLRGAQRNFIAPLSSLILILGVFTLTTRMHERYLFPGMALALMLYVLSGDYRAGLLFVGVTLSVTLNSAQTMALAMKDNYWIPVHDPLFMATSVVTVLSLLLALCLGWRMAGGDIRMKAAPAQRTGGNAK